jgi:hypothetical protein
MKLYLFIFIFLCSSVFATDAFLMPTNQFTRFKNRLGPKGEGSCVWVSIAAQGAHANNPNAEYIISDNIRGKPSPYGPANLDGSWPERVGRAASQRKLSIYNVEGPSTIEWIDWHLRRGGYASITYGVGHMLNAVGITKNGYLLNDNNYPTEIREVSREVFIREHRLHGGGWTVILVGDAPPPWKMAKPERINK